MISESDLTYIEFYDVDSIENIVSCLATVPARVILLGADGEKMTKAGGIYASLFRARGHEVAFLPQVVDVKDLSALADALMQIVDRYPNCCVDLTGGSALFLAAIGAVWKQKAETGVYVQLHRFNFADNVVEDCDGDGNVISSVPAPRLTVEELIRIYGGRVMMQGEVKGGTQTWDITEEFAADVMTMWNIARRTGEPGGVQKAPEYLRRWNHQCAVFGAVDLFGSGHKTPLSDCVPLGSVQHDLRDEHHQHVDYTHDRYIIDKLKKAGLCAVSTENNEYRIFYKNGQVKRVLTKAGQLLELVVYIYALEAKDASGGRVYTDARTGVYIDWDGVPDANGHDADTCNEIDVLLMHNLIPVFVSCKNGLFEAEELYKLNSVASRFGSKYARAYVAATALARCRNEMELRERASDMDIRIFEPQNFTEAQFKERIKNLWR